MSKDDYQAMQRERFYSTLALKKPKNKKARYKIDRLCRRRRPDEATPAP
jgi:hypothetical protein